MNQLKKLSFVGGPKDGYYREHPEDIIPNLYLFTINNKTVRYILIDQDDYEALYEYESDYEALYEGYEEYVNFSTFNLGGPWPWDKSV